MDQSLDLFSFQDPTETRKVAIWINKFSVL